MSLDCFLEHKEAINNLKSDLSKSGYKHIPLENRINYKAFVEHNRKVKVEADKIQQVINNWESSLRKIGIYDPVVHHIMSPFQGDMDSKVGISRQRIDIQFNTIALDKLDNYRKKLGIYESKLSLSSYFERQRLEKARIDNEERLKKDENLQRYADMKESWRRVTKILQKLFPAIKFNMSYIPKWATGDNVFNQEEYVNQVNYRLKVIENISNNISKVKQWESNKNINEETLYKKIQELGVPKEQIRLLKESKGNTVEEKLLDFANQYSYTVEINTATKNEIGVKETYNPETGEIDIDNIEPDVDYIEEYDEEGNIIGMKPVLSEKGKKQLEEVPTQYYSSLTVPGGTNYTENRITTPLITPSIKGHAQFAKNNDIGWFRSDEKLANLNELDNIEDIGQGSKTRRVLEMQSDLFQKGRNKSSLVATNEMSKRTASQQIDFTDVDDSGLRYFKKEGKYFVESVDGIEELTEEQYQLLTGEIIVKKNIYDNQFLQLLNKDNNWVTFFIKSIIQDTAKQTITEVQESDVEAKVRELEKEGLLEIDCKGKLKAEKGLQTNFTKGGKWKLIKDLKGYPTHKEGGVDLTIGKNGVSIKNGNIQFTAKHGLVIPKN